MAELNVYQRPDNNWGWRLISDNGNVIATDGGQGYEHEAVAQKMAEQVLCRAGARDIGPRRRGSVGALGLRVA